jgi:hypothetical protein
MPKGSRLLQKNLPKSSQNTILMSKTMVDVINVILHVMEIK